TPSSPRRSSTLLRSASIEHLAQSSRNRLVLIACILGSSIVFVDGSVVNVALPSIQRDLGGGLALQQWVVDAYLLTLGALLLVGWLITHGSWRWVFLINVPIAVATTALILSAVPRREGGNERARVDVVGGVLCVLGLGGPVFALIEEPRRGWGNPLIFGMFGG